MKIRIPGFGDATLQAVDGRHPEVLSPADGAAPRVVIHLDATKLQMMLVEVAVNAWKAQARLASLVPGELAADHKRLQRNVDAILTSLGDFGVRVKDHTGDPYDYGQPLKIVAAQPQVGITREVVTETIRPTVSWGEHILQRGEVVIATPTEEEA